MYQGYNKLDNRQVNYFAMSKKEALNYGVNVRAVSVELSKPLLKASDSYYDLIYQFKLETNDRNLVDILDNSKEGLTRQFAFFDFLKKKGYDGISFLHQGCFFYPSSDSRYVICFYRKSFNVLNDKEIGEMSGLFIKQLNKRASENYSKVLITNLKNIYENHNISKTEREFVSIELKDLGFLNKNIPDSFYTSDFKKSVLCCGVNADGKRCSKKTLKGNGLCSIHQF